MPLSRNRAGNTGGNTLSAYQSGKWHGGGCGQIGLPSGLPFAGDGVFFCSDTVSRVFRRIACARNSKADIAVQHAGFTDGGDLPVLFAAVHKEKGVLRIIGVHAVNIVALV